VSRAAALQVGEGASVNRGAHLRLARAGHGLHALALLLAFALQVAITIRAPALPPGHAVGTLGGTGLPSRLVRVVSFFTIESNLLVLLCALSLLLDPERDGRVWRVLRLDALMGIAVTGIVYATVLARVHEPKGTEQVLSNAIFHYASPLAAVILWLAFGPRPRITRRVVLAALLWPAAWLIYTLVRGALSHWYPYPFLDAATEGYGKVLLNSLLVLIVLGIVAVVLLWGDRLPSASGAAPPNARSR
jgi:hypothetical protein